MKYLIVWCVVLLMGSISISAQKIKITEVDFNARVVPSNIIDLDQDEKGKLWFVGNEAGLFSYDGTNLISFPAQPDDSNTPSSQRQECVLVDSEGYIWIGTFSRGLDRYNPKTETFEHFYHDVNDPNSIRSNAIRALIEDANGNIWIGTESGLDRYDKDTGHFVHQHTDDVDEELLNEEHVRVLYEDKSGIIWIGCSSPFANESTPGGLFALDIDNNSVTVYRHQENNPQSLVDNRVRAIMEDSRGNFWVGTAGDGLHTMDRATGTFTRHSYDPSNPTKLSRPPLANTKVYADDHITFIVEDNEGFVWIGTFEGGLSRYYPNAQKVSRIGDVDGKDLSFITESTWRGFITSDGQLWISIWESTLGSTKLLKINTSAQKLEKRELPNLGNVRSFYESKNGDLYIGTGSSLWKQEPSGRLLNQFNLPLDIPLRGGVIDILEDNGLLWCGTGNGLYSYNLTNGELNNYLPYPPNDDRIVLNTIWTVKKLQDGRMACGTLLGVEVFNIETEQFDSFPHEVEEEFDFGRDINCVLEYEPNKLLVGTLHYGLKELDLSTGIYTEHILRIGSQGVLAMLQDINDVIWVGSTDGLFYYDAEKETFETYVDTDIPFIEHNFIRSITEGKDGSLWILTDNGIVNINSENKESRIIGESWGIYLYDMTYHNGSYTAQNGEIYFAENDRYFVIPPNDIDTSKHFTSKPYIDQFYIDGSISASVEDFQLDESIDKAEKVTLANNQNNISFKIGFSDYLTEDKDKRLQYRLTNYDDIWHIMESGDRISFSNLNTGEYNLELKAANLFGEWTYSNLSIEVLPPWWKSTWAYLLYAGVFAFFGWRVHLFQKDRFIKIEKERNQELELAHAKEIEKAFTDLKNTQSQLIHAEKMASLGELTAGIAHEIQNPLNFVNNFSEVSSELFDEMSEEIEKGDIEEVKSISSSIKQNLEKIHHHGQRASKIVRGMLDHSRASTDEKVPTDINALCDEYVRLTYHGLRAKDKSFNANFITDFDKKIGELNIIPQDMGRVLLNILNNAFYAVNDKRKNSVNGYQPEVKVTTKKIGDQVQIIIQDNGSGIPQELVDKIFQPFFTTKPTGSGTGLGLSLAYDIITKGHGGALEVDSKEGEGTVFKIILN